MIDLPCQRPRRSPGWLCLSWESSLYKKWWLGVMVVLPPEETVYFLNIKACNISKCKVDSGLVSVCKAAFGSLLGHELLQLKTKRKMVTKEEVASRHAL
ncbi:hypothetical protein P8452_37869 [Trifolium repens]|nr:hypothetical protein P8452_37869 [Trifolium repens]